MHTTRLLNVGIEGPADVVTVRQRARQLSAMLGFSQQEQVRIATAVSELARCVCRRVYGGRALFAFEQDHERRLRRLIVTMRDNGGVEKAAAGVSGVATESAASELDSAIATARRLMDQCEVCQQADHALTVSMHKLLSSSQLFDHDALTALASTLAQAPPADSFIEAQQQNHELAGALAELRERQDDLLALTRELEDTNRGVLALYAEIEEKAEKIRKADEMKSRFLSNTSHELRTPLSSIRALTQLLLDRMDGELSVEQERQIGFIASAANDLSNLVNDLLDLAKIEAGKVAINIAPIDVGALFGALRAMLRPLAQNPAVQLQFIEPPAAVDFDSDEPKVALILRNFVSNALKFTERGTVTVTLAMAPAAAANRLRFEVRDSGIGIRDDHLQLIFEEFSQIEHPLQRGVKGTGLGLPLCRKFATLLGGEVEVSSIVGEGSTFSLILPRHLSAPAPPAP
ncbi:sensor histidine kinase [Massilia sp. PWRC2]|uniref:sensor histidine kinase n=1 Tax=Massilia sp. PWRC2 TaxID=2804626 RepID=UPI003CE99B12